MIYNSVSVFFWNLNETKTKRKSGAKTASWAYRKQTLLWLQWRQNVFIQFCLLCANLSIYLGVINFKITFNDVNELAIIIQLFNRFFFDVIIQRFALWSPVSSCNGKINRIVFIELWNDIYKRPPLKTIYYFSFRCWPLWTCLEYDSFYIRKFKEII